MAKVVGNAGSVDTGSAVTGIKNWSLASVGNTEDVTDFDSSGLKEFLATLTEWSGSFGGFFNEVAPTAVGSSVTLKLYVDATKYITGTALITGFNINTSAEGVAEMSYDYQGTGTLTLTNLVA